MESTHDAHWRARILAKTAPPPPPPRHPTHQHLGAAVLVPAWVLGSGRSSYVAHAGPESLLSSPHYLAVGPREVGRGYTPRPAPAGSQLVGPLHWEGCLRPGTTFSAAPWSYIFLPSAAACVTA
jgi:hypothetical protein